MANYLNISGKLDNSKPGLILGPGEEYEIDDRKTTVIKVQEIIKKSKGESEGMDQALELLLGKPALAKIEEKHPGATTRLSSLRVLFTAVTSSVAGLTYDEGEAQFRKG